MGNAPQYTPKTLKHPQFRKGKITVLPNKDTQGEPDLFPDITVNNDQQEAFYRAKGYLEAGEAPPTPAAYSEYPMMLSHPDHVDAVADDFDIKKGKEGEAPITTRIPGSPEKMPAVMVNSAAEEKSWTAKGYARIGKTDADASQRAKAAPYDPNYHKSEYPKIVDGQIVDPHATIDHNRYPMYVGDKLVNSAAEEAEARGFKVAAAPKPTAATGDKPKSSKRAQAGLKAAETRRLKKERAGQAASPQG